MPLNHVKALMKLNREASFISAPSVRVVENKYDKVPEVINCLAPVLKNSNSG
jgi:hypothetical protein